MIIGIIGAMEQEVAPLLDRMSYFFKCQKAGCEIYKSQSDNVEIILVKSGIGKVSAALGTTLLINHYKSELVINIGSAGSLTPKLKIGDIVIPYAVIYHDVNMTAFNYAPGQIANLPISFNADLSLIEVAKKIINRLNISAAYGLMVSGDSFINTRYSSTRIIRTFPQAIAVDMEATAIGHICHQFAIPFVIVRAISDILSQTPSCLNFKKSLTLASLNSSHVVYEIVKTLTK